MLLGGRGGARMPGTSFIVGSMEGRNSPTELEKTGMRKGTGFLNLQFCREAEIEALVR